MIVLYALDVTLNVKVATVLKITIVCHAMMVSNYIIIRAGINAQTKLILMAIFVLIVIKLAKSVQIQAQKIVPNVLLLYF